MTVQPDCDVLVVGAGISGLTIAYRLSQRGFRVELVEAAERAGGVIGTGRTDGFLYEHGPNSILDTTPLIDALLRDLGIAGERIETLPQASKRYIVRGGRLVPAPASLATFLTTPLFPPKAKLRLMCEPFVRRGAGDESVAQFVTRRLGRELLDYAIEPFVAGIHAGDPDELSVAAAFPRLVALEQRYGSLIAGQILGARERAKQAGAAKNAAHSFSFRGGMQTLTDALARSVGILHTGTRVAALERAPDGTIVVRLEGPTRQRTARAVVLAVPADRTANLVRTFAPDAANALEHVPYAPIVSVARAYARTEVVHALDGFGFLVPRVEKRCLLGSLFSSSLFEGRAPAGTVLITSFIGGRRQPQLASCPDDEIEHIVGTELQALLGARGKPLFSAVTRWPRAIPQYTLGHRERVQRAEAAETALPGLYLCAAFRDGVSVGDRIQSAHETVEKVALKVRVSCR